MSAGMAANLPTFEEALETVLQYTAIRPTEEVVLEDCPGRVLAEDVCAPIDLPPFDNSAVDGYAIGSLDCREFSLVGELAAGSAEEISIDRGQACRVFTGSRLPAGAQAVVMQEVVTARGRTLCISETPREGEYIRKQGEEIEKGQTVLASGSLINPSTLGLLATLGYAVVRVFGHPRVTVIGTGSELVTPGNPLLPGQVYESNTYGVRAALHAVGLKDVSIGRVTDDLGRTKETFAAALEHSDVLIVCGGMSVGDHDYARAALSALGVKELVWRVRIKPGKPFYFGIAASGQLVFGLPGNPVSALVVFTLFVKPALSKMIGRDPVVGRRTAAAGERFQGSMGRDDFLRGRVRADKAYSNEAQGSHMLTGLAGAEVLVRIPGDTQIQVGDPVEVIPLNWWTMGVQ